MGRITCESEALEKHHVRAVELVSSFVLRTWQLPDAFLALLSSAQLKYQVFLFLRPMRG